jgi:hypothetical protein
VFQPGIGTGNSLPSSLIFKAQPYNAASGSAAQPMTEVCRVSNGKMNFGDGYITTGPGAGNGIRIGRSGNNGSIWVGDYGSYVDALCMGISTFLGWHSTSNSPGSVGVAPLPDTALIRNAAGVVEINNGTAGQFRDQVVRKLYLGGVDTTVSWKYIDLGGQPHIGLERLNEGTCRAIIGTWGLFQAGGIISWVGSGVNAAGAPDVGLQRDAVGVLAVYDGVIQSGAGNYRDLKLRNIIYATPAADGTASGPVTSDYNAGYATAVGDLMYLDAAATWQKTDANTSYDGLPGIALEVKTAGQAVKVALPGSTVWAAARFPTFTVGGPVYMSETAGDVTQTKPPTTDSATRVMGWAVHADKMYFFPEPSYVTHV